MRIAIVTALAGFATLANAQIGAPVTASGGDVIVTILGSDAGYTSDLYFESVGGPVLIGSNRDTGLQLNLGNFNPGDELLFRLHVRDTGNDFYTGDAARNPDGIAHANIAPDAGFSIVGFEDLLGGGDRDYNDCQFRFENVVPAPGVGSIALAGLALAARRRRR